ncbi:hypothetical protein EJM73_06610 [Clostridium botulinum]|uniref:Uncharacterized protein n=1 Tax=Clostridium sporogenes TaxID=1509 RepID=A0A7X5SZG9_CLOSG|nr:MULTISPECIES: hypothetical protein [Clostridium]AJD29231.1 hypothetical protein T258_4047 [Clostridium botulinum Prevot_594]KEI84186.1 hypothetical protein N493_20135 [Clostridium botulinum B2 433]NCI20629.1 hypothetical protein [Clostridium botulinum]NCI35337.1 hypothetical protein [Clostridium botulinum]NCI72070.1 hypothetical protein [Clostridium botulinum]
MKKIRAIYVGDVRFEQCLVFQLNKETDYFEMLVDKEFRYKKECIEEDADWLIFEVDIDEDKAKLLNGQFTT